MKKIEKKLIVFLFITLITLCFLQIIFRFALNLSLSWTEELSRYVFILLVYLSACAAVLEDAHVRVEIIDGFVKGVSKKYLDTFVDLSFILFIGFIGYYGFEISLDAFDVNLHSPAIQVSMGIVYLIIPISFLLTCIRLCQRIYYRFNPQENK
ncbi:MAG: TRAP transporter small permease [Lentisphaeraceae bacterium]|nr:TRAP transporter small permease [Lentisphaeraceae bacterium]